MLPDTRRSDVSRRVVDPLLGRSSERRIVYNVRPTDMEAIAATRLQPERAAARRDRSAPAWLSRLVDQLRLPKVRVVVAIRKEA